MKMFLLLGVICGMLSACAEFKDAGRSIGHGTRDAAVAIGQGTKRVYNEVVKDGEEAVKD